MNTLELTLCYQCANTFYSFNDHDVKRKDYKQTIKGECDICKGRGFDYIIKVVSNGKRI